MRINCSHGFFRFDEVTSGELSEFVSVIGLELGRRGDYFTFTDLVDAPDYSIKGAQYLGVTALATFAGEPWEIFEANGFAYDFNLRSLVQIQAVTKIARVQQAGNVYVSTGLLLPGSLTDGGKRVRDYAAWFSTDRMRFRYSEVNFV